MVRRGAKRAGLGIAVVACLLWSSGGVYAETLQSPHYQFDESTLGAGGLGQSNSNNYSASGGVGDIGAGNSASTNYQVNAGSNTTKDPTLSFAITHADANLGSFSASAAATATASFVVSNYTSYGYVVQITGDAPTNDGHTISPLTANTASISGTEQFGINLVANTSPVSVGTNPDNGQFGHGEAALNYGDSNKYRYVSGETIALAPKSSGITQYTMTYLVNVGSLTPGGKYTSDQTLIVTGTY